jgi:hypothetical protein
LVTVAAVRRLHPRHWDGHRLLQFLTGLALLALAFGTPPASAAPASPPATAVTAVEAPDAAVSVVEAPDAAVSVVEAPAAAVSVVEASPAAVSAVDARAAAAAPVVRDEVASAPPRTGPRPEECAHDASRAARAVPPVADAATLAGIAQRAHGSRAPPRR